MSTTSEGGVKGFSTSGITVSNEKQVRASFSSIDARGLVDSITLNEGDSYTASFFYRKVGDSSWNEKVVGEFENARVIRSKITGLSSNTDYEYYLSINGGDSLSGSVQSAQTYKDTTLELTESVTTSRLPVETVGSAGGTRNSLVLQGRIGDAANLESGDFFRPSFLYREQGDTDFIEIDLSNAGSTGLFE